MVRDLSPALAAELPGPTASPIDVADEAVLVLERHGRIDDALFQSLEARRPRFAAEIRMVAAQFRSAEESAPSYSAALQRLRTALAAGHGMLRLFGFPHRGAKPVTHLQDTCVPMRMCRGNSVVPWTIERLLGHLRAARLPAARVIVLGGPGSGKSTLCQYLTVLLAQDGAAETSIVPLYLRLRDNTGHKYSLLELAASRARELQAPVDVDTLTRICDDGHAVLIVDGLDEVGDAAARSDQRDRLLAFLSLHPRVPVLIASREVGYSEVPFPDSGMDAFLHLTMAPLDDDEVADFARRWYAAIEPDTGRREQGAADLVASIEAAPEFRELATNRLLMTLIALIHREDARLPGERVALLERCTQLCLDTWPRARGKRFMTIPLERQRRLLERLAAGLLPGRQHIFQDNVTLPRAYLIDAFVGHWQADAPAPDDVLTVVSEWIDYLHEEAGLLPEIGPGQYQFVHRMFQEYLAACWYAHATEDPIGLLIERYAETTEREVWRMLAALHAAEPGPAERLYQRLKGAPGQRPETWIFLLDCLGEEAAFSPSATAEILGHALQLPAYGPSASAVERAIARLWRFSARHGVVVRAWLEHRLRAGLSEELSATVWAATVATSADDICAWLNARPDRSQAAATLASVFWPLGPHYPVTARPELDAVGRWAWSAVDLHDAVAHVAGSLPATELQPAAVMAIQAGLDGPAVGALAWSLADKACALAAATVASPAWREVGMIAVYPGGWLLPTAIDPLPAWRSSTIVDSGGPSERSWRYPRGWFVPALRDDGTCEPNAVSDRFDGIGLFDYLVGPDDPVPDDFWVDALKSYGEGCFEEADEFGDYEALDPGNDYPLKEFERDEMRSLEPGFTVNDCAVPRHRVGPPDAMQDPEPYRTRARLLAARGPCRQPISRPPGSDAALVQIAEELHALHAAQVVIAARTFARDRSVAALASRLRQQSVWVLQNWHAVELSARADCSPARLALVLALGLSQCLTTGHWPSTPQWRAWLAGPPPAHEWPRLFWHLCWATAVPDDPVHRSGLCAAVTAVASNPEFSSLAPRVCDTLAPDRA